MFARSNSFRTVPSVAYLPRITANSCRWKLRGSLGSLDLPARLISALSAPVTRLGGMLRTVSGSDSLL